MTGKKHTSAAPLPDAWAGQVLDFWFRDLEQSSWFKRDADLDRRIIERFGSLHARVSALPMVSATATPATSLATVLVLDQFSRNMFRGSPRAFASDSRALEIARHVVDGGADRHMSRDERLFLYLPFEHSESLADQEISVRLISVLCNDRYTAYAIAHRDIIVRFGRYPHRNAVLGRASTPEEVAFLATPGSSF